jgi:hypothetical protein
VVLNGGLLVDSNLNGDVFARKTLNGSTQCGNIVFLNPVPDKGVGGFQNKVAVIHLDRREGFKPGVEYLRVNFLTEDVKNLFPEFSGEHFSLIYHELWALRHCLMCAGLHTGLSTPVDKQKIPLITTRYLHISACFLASHQGSVELWKSGKKCVISVT